MYLQHEMRDTIFNGLLKQSSQNTPLSNFSESSHSCLLFYKRKITPNICRALCRSEHVVIMFLFWTTCTWTLACFKAGVWSLQTNGPILMKKVVYLCEYGKLSFYWLESQWTHLWESFNLKLLLSVLLT